jgi:hypothetical protein
MYARPMMVNGEHIDTTNGHTCGANTGTAREACRVCVVETHIYRTTGKVVTL